MRLSRLTGDARRPAPAPEAGVDDFRLFPEPRVFRPGAATFPLAGFAAPQGFSARTAA